MKNEMARIYSYGRGCVIVALDSDVTRDVDAAGIAWYRVAKAATIRQWGTSNGLSELCVRGPLSATQLDPIATETAIPVMALHDCRTCRDPQVWIRAINEALLRIA